MPPKVSVVIVNYNTFELSCLAIKSVYRQTVGVRFELILVDNASTECHPSRFKKLFPDIVLVPSAENGGFAKGNNMGIALARGKYILLLNSDAELLNDAIALSVARLEREPCIGALSAKLQYADGRLQHPAQRFDTPRRELRELLRLNKFLSPSERGVYYLGEAFDHITKVECDWIWGAFFFFPKKIVELLPEKRLADHFFMYAEDVQWCYQIGKLGYKIVYFPDAVAMHHLGGSDTNRQTADEKYFSRLLPNRYRVLQMEKGKVYAFFTYLIRALHLFSLRTKINRQKARNYFRVLLK